MAKLSGKFHKVTVKVGSNSEVELDIRKSTFNDKTDLVDTSTTTSAGWMEDVAGLSGVDFSVDCVYNDAKDPYGASNAIVSGCTATVKFYTDSTDTAEAPKLSGTFMLSEVNWDADVKGGIDVSIKGKSQGAVSRNA